MRFSPPKYRSQSKWLTKKNDVPKKHCRNRRTPSAVKTFELAYLFSGEFGPVVEQTMFRPPNMVISASKSGKMENRHLNQWVDKVFVPSTGENALLVVDSWSAFTEQNIRRMIPETKNVTIKQIPPGKYYCEFSYPLPNYNSHLKVVNFFFY